MSWRGNLRPASFRGASFLYDTTEDGGGRRVIQHEFPLRDEPYTEDMGRRARTHTLNAFVLGPDYMGARDALMDALEAEGPGTLIHPRLGSKEVAVDRYELVERTRRGGMAEFRIIFIESGPRELPVRTEDTAAGLMAAADAAEGSILDDFAAAFDVLSLPVDMLASVGRTLDSAISAVENVVGAIMDPIMDLVTAPFDLAAQVMDGIRRVRGLAGGPLRIARMWQSILGRPPSGPGAPNPGQPGFGMRGQSAPSAPDPAYPTPARIQQVRAERACQRLVRRAEAIEACRAAAEAPFETRDEAIAHRDACLARIDEELAAPDPGGGPIADPVFAAFTEMRARLVTDIRERGANLPRLGSYTPAETLPALVIAHKVHGDARRDGDIVARNRPRHPGFVQGGEPLEVVRD